jgi:hypothetical protein
MSLRVILFSEVKVFSTVSRSESESEKGVQLEGIDAKLCDLPMARLKLC